MARIIEEVAIRIGADTRQLTKGMKDANKRVGTLTKGVKGLGLALVGAFGARALFRGFQRTLESTDALIKTAKGVGFTVDEYQRLVFALDSVGVSAESARIGLGDLQKRLGNENFAKFYKQVGLDPKELRKLSPAQQLEAAFTALQQFRGNQSLLVSRAGGVFEEQAGKDFAKVINQWEDFVKARRDYDKRVGTIGGGAVKDIEGLRRETKLLGAQWQTIKMQLVAEMAPAIKQLLDGIGAHRGLKKVGQDLAFIVSNIAKLIGKLIELRSVMPDQLSRVFGGMVSRPGEETPDETAARLSSSSTARHVNLTTPQMSDTPMMTAARLSAQQGQNMSFDVTVNGDTGNNRRLGKEIAAAAERERRAGQLQ